MFNNFLDKVFFNNRILDYFICLGVFLLSLIIIKIFQHIILKKLKVWAEKTRTTLDDFLVELFAKLAVPFGYFAALYASLKYLTLPAHLDKVINVAAIAILTIFSVRLVIRIIGYGLTIYLGAQGKTQALKHSLKGILAVTKFIIWVLAVIFFLDNLGFKISTVIAGLGIGGVAIALAAQAILKDLFSYFSIIFDRPFEVGDFIIIGDLLGTVEHIGIKTTRIRSLGGEQLIFSNSDLTDSRLRNYKRMQKRRVVFKLGVVYQTSLENLKQMPKVIEEIVKGVKDTAFDRAHFLSYEDFSLLFEIVYYVLSRDYNKYMDVQQEINFAIKEEFEKRGIDFAFPTRTIYTVKQG